jgi:hypothetical protein
MAGGRRKKASVEDFSLGSSGGTVARGDDVRFRVQAGPLGLAADVSSKESSANKNAASGYAGLNASGRITKGADVTDDLIVDTSGKGLVLKDTQGTPHYWRLGILAGLVVATDLGTTKP